ncbi:hypothetical protein Ahy_A06g029404 [Arachis hypogaea]|uniref:MULE transposase domain-containing protein n=1 Tax=Arachis hypogaea TaxID=3818 RepID=A0A445CTB4_ARAHY|nr:hypothetical protein Ahy_A06g029404 [Arachis hypogaea]
MNDSTSNQLNESDLDYSSERTRCVVDEQFVPKVGMTFKTLEEAGKFNKNYSKLAGFSTKIRNTTRKRDVIKNQLITNPSAGISCPARIYVHILKDVELWTISKVVQNHSHPCCPDRTEMLKQHRELSMFVRRAVETNEEARIRSSKTYQSFVVAAGSHQELSFIEKDVKNYIIREVRNVSKQDDAKKFGKYLLRMKEKNQNFSTSKAITPSKMHSRPTQEAGLHVSISETWFHSTPRTTQTGIRFTEIKYLHSPNLHISVHNFVRVSIYSVFGTFMGVNHHGQTTLLGCALMKNEDIQSFKWLFECWLRSMGGKAPKGILTDQYASMQGPLRCACQQQFTGGASSTS